MTGARGDRRRMWQWAIGVWAAAVVAASGLTLWLQDSAEPPEPKGWEATEEPAPLLHMDEGDDGYPCPSGGTDPNGSAVVLCAYVTTTR